MATPVQEMSDARQAIKAADDVGADHHAATTLQSAQDAMALASRSLDSGDYEQARMAASVAKALAILAREQAMASARGEVD